MNKLKTYQKISSLINARLNCIESGNKEWKLIHEEKLTDISQSLPSGSGIDTGSKINLDKSKPEKIVINTAFHHMDEHGGYDGWTEHEIIVTPSLQFGFKLHVTGRNRDMIKTYLADMFNEALESTIV